MATAAKQRKTGAQVGVDGCPPARDLRADLQVLMAQLKAVYLEREDLIKLMLTAYISKQNLFIGGAPGTAKTALSRTVAGAFATRSFYYLVSPTTQTEEVLGPVNLKALQAGEFERDLIGRLADSHLAILDEIFKASSPLLNALLGVILERKIVNGKTEVLCPLVSLVGCSNELPEEYEGLAPFWDRFVLRYWVDEVSHKSRSLLMCRQAGLNTVPQIDCTFTLAELEVMQYQASCLPIPRDVINAINDIVSKTDIPVSTRRLMQLIDLLKAWAYVQGDTQVEEEHLNLLKHVLWQRLEQRNDLNQLIDKRIHRVSEDVKRTLKNALEVLSKVEDITQEDMFTTKATYAAAESKLTEMVNTLNHFARQIQRPKQLAQITSAVDEINHYRDQVSKKLAQILLNDF